MTEAEWLACPGPKPLLDHFPGFGQHSFKSRKLRLFVCASCRRAWELLADPRSRRCVEASERYADGLADVDELEGAWLDAYRVNHPDNRSRPLRYYAATAEQTAAEAATIAGWSHTDCGMAFEVQGPTQGAVARLRGREPDWGYREDFIRDALEAAWQADVVRDVFGPLPFRPVSPLPAPLPSSAVSVAQAAYDDRILPSGGLDPQRLAVLADVIEEVGAAGELLTHLRSPGPHVRGCWALDLILGKEGRA